MTIVDWASLPISLVALVVSIYAARQSSQHRRGDRYVEAARVAAECGAKMVEITARAKSLQPEWHAFLHARGISHSTVREQIDQDLERIVQDAESVQPRLSELANTLDSLSSGELDQRLVGLSSLKIAIDVISSRLADSENKLKESKENYRASNNSRR